MALYDLQEQDQIDDLKAWWNRYGGTVAVALVIGLPGHRGNPGMALVRGQAAPRMHRCCTAR